MRLKLKNTHARNRARNLLTNWSNLNCTTRQSGTFFLTITMHRFYTSTQNLQSLDNSVIYFYKYSVRMILFIQAPIQTSLRLNWASLVYCQ